MAGKPRHQALPQLLLEPLHDLGLAQDLLPVFNSNPDFLAISEPGTGRRSNDLEDIRKLLREELERPDSRCLAIWTRQERRLVGLACLLVPHPREPFPWLGLLIIDGRCQGQGYGAEALRTLEAGIVAEGWPELRLGVLKANPSARRFWEREGFHEYDDTADSDNRPCWLMRKPLAPHEDRA